MNTAVGARDALRHPGPAHLRSCSIVREGRSPWSSGNPCTAAGRSRAQHGRWWLLSHEVVTWAMYEAPSVRTEAGKRDSTARQVLVVLAEKAWPDGTNSYPKPETIAEATDLEVRTVQRALRRLAEAKLIERTGKRPSGTAIWRLNMSLTRSLSDEEELSAKQEARRAANAARVRKHREASAAAKAAKEAADTEGAPAAPVMHSDRVTGAGLLDGVTRSECITGECVEGCVTHSDCVRNALKVRSVTHLTPPEPPKGTTHDSPSGGRRAAPQSPAQLHPVADVRSGLVSDLEFVGSLTTRERDDLPAREDPAPLPPDVVSIITAERSAEYERMDENPVRRPRTRKQRLRDRPGHRPFPKGA